MLIHALYMIQNPHFYFTVYNYLGVTFESFIIFSSQTYFKMEKTLIRYLQEDYNSLRIKKKKGYNTALIITIN